MPAIFRLSDPDWIDEELPDDWPRQDKIAQAVLANLAAEEELSFGRLGPGSSEQLLRAIILLRREGLAVRQHHGRGILTWAITAKGRRRLER